MKKYIIIGLFLFSQTVMLAQSLKKSTLNSEYRVLESVHIQEPLDMTNYEISVKSALSNQVQDIQHKIATYKPNEVRLRNSKSGYKVAFKSNKGYASVVYDKYGVIIRSNESYEDIIIPESIRNSISNQYPNWGITDDFYSVVYEENKETKKVLTVNISNYKNDESLTLKFDLTKYSY